MKKIIVLFHIAFFSTVLAQGQSLILEKINKIKSQPDVYYWGQYTHPDIDTAIEGAAKSVLIDINIQRKNDDLPPETIDWLMPKVKHIKINRGNLVRIFAYVKIEDVTNKNSTLALSDDGKEDGIIASSTMNTVGREFLPDAFVQKILEQKSFQNVYKLLRELKAKGEVLQFGSLSDVEEYESLDLILFDLGSKEVISLLSPITQGNMRTNLVTGGADSLDNYPEDMVAVIWYIK